MRSLLLAIWAVLTGLTVYSAFWHKAPAIENDITTRTAEAITGAGGVGDLVNVDGRNVTLRGEVASISTESQFLGLADDVYGALGPVDQLTVAQQAAKTFVRAERGDNGIILSGIVGSEDERASLVGAATALNAGAVDDQLIVGGGQSGWLGDAQSGLAQLGGLTAGSLYVADDGRSISGSAPDEATAMAAKSLGGSWSSFVSSPQMEDPRIAELTGEVAQKDKMLGSLQGSLDDSIGRIGELTGTVAERDKTIADFTSQLSALEGEKTGLMSQLSDSKSMLDENTGKIGELTTALAAAKALASKSSDQIRTDLQNQLAERDDALNSLEGKYDAALGRISDLNNEGAGFKARIANLEAEGQSYQGRITSLEGELSAAKDLSASAGEKDSMIASLKDDTASLQALNAQLRGDVETRDGQITDLTGLLGQRDTQIASLREENQSSEVTIVDLMTRLNSSKSEEPMSMTDLAALCNTRAQDLLAIGRINFVTNGSDIQADSIPLLDQISNLILECSDEQLNVMIGGHTDSQGSDDYNQQLSEARANSVRDYILGKGANENNLVSQGFGETQPIADNGTSAGRAQNRRISFEWTILN